MVTDVGNLESRRTLSFHAKIQLQVATLRRWYSWNWYKRYRVGWEEVFKKQKTT